VYDGSVSWERDRALALFSDSRTFASGLPTCAARPLRGRGSLAPSWFFHRL